jgi:hypothetical protein
MGLFYGPVIMLLLVTTTEIYIERYGKEDSVLLKETVMSRLDNPDEEEAVLEG